MEAPCGTRPLGGSIVATNLRYETDLTDEERDVFSVLLPEPARRGRRPAWPMRGCEHELAAELAQDPVLSGRVKRG